jgi:predicted house-cleaning noncanonical NTP pyrophosphatase (MazG superfamily)
VYVFFVLLVFTFVICGSTGSIPCTRIIEDDGEYSTALIEKLREETREIEEDPNLDELADALEVIYAIGKALGYTPGQIEEARIQKVQERGGFDKRIFLISTEDAPKP